MSAPIPSGLSPEETINKFYQYARIHDSDNLMALSHPALIEERNYALTSMINNGPQRLKDLEEVTILNIQSEEAATATISLVINDRSHSVKMQLKKHQGEWRVFSFSPYW